MFGVLEVDCFWYEGSLLEQIIESQLLQAVLLEVREAGITSCTNV